MKLSICGLLLFSCLVGGRPISKGGSMVPDATSGRSKDADAGNTPSAASSWELDYEIYDSGSSHDESDELKIAKQAVTRSPFNKFELMSSQKNGVPLIRTCHDGHMTVALPRETFGSGNLVFLRSDCLFDMQVNDSYVSFNLSYDVFSEQPCSYCCKNLRAIRYDIGVAYVFEVPIDVFVRDGDPQFENLMAYCYLETARLAEHVATHASIRLYSSMYDRTPFSGTIMQLSAADVAFLEIVAEEGPSDMENVPINCWLSTLATKNDSLKDMTDSLFLENGCPTRADVSVASYYAKPYSRISNVGGPRVGFTLAASKLQDKKFLYVHCQYVRCSTMGEADVSGKLPLCPKHSDCTRSTPANYEKRQLSTATSDVVLVLAKRPPQEVLIQAAPKTDNKKACGPTECSRSEAANGNSQEKDNCAWSVGTLFGLCSVSFVLGVLLVTLILYIRKRYARPVPYGRRQTRLDEETSVSGLSLMGARKGSAIPLPHGPPDVLAQTPESKRVHLCRQPSGRHRHLAGHDGRQPNHPANSLHADLSRAGQSTIGRVDEAWNRKIVTRDDID